MFYSQHNCRVFVNNQEARKLLFDFADTGLEDRELRHLLDLLNLYQPALIGLVEYCLENCLRKPPLVLKDIIKDLSRKVAVTAILNPTEDVLVFNNVYLLNFL